MDEAGDAAGDVVYVMLFAVAALPIIVSLTVFGYLTRAGIADGETHCRKCGYILRGISEPRCPECGERI